MQGKIRGHVDRRTYRLVNKAMSGMDKSYFKLLLLILFPSLGAAMLEFQLKHTTVHSCHAHLQ